MVTTNLKIEREIRFEPIGGENRWGVHVSLKTTSQSYYHTLFESKTEIELPHFQTKTQVTRSIIDALDGNLLFSLGHDGMNELISECQNLVVHNCEDCQSAKLWNEQRKKDFCPICNW
jgi:hypothetical protein